MFCVQVNNPAKRALGAAGRAAKTKKSKTKKAAKKHEWARGDIGPDDRVNVYDVETSGLCRDNDFIMQLAALNFPAKEGPAIYDHMAAGGKITEPGFMAHHDIFIFNEFILPYKRFDPERNAGAFKVHGITKAKLDAEGSHPNHVAADYLDFLDTCSTPASERTADGVATYAGVHTRTIQLAHNGTAFDLRFLVKALGRAGRKLPGYASTHLDTLHLFTYGELGQAPPLTAAGTAVLKLDGTEMGMVGVYRKRSLAKLYIDLVHNDGFPKHLGVTSHDALGDVLALFMTFETPLVRTAVLEYGTGGSTSFTFGAITC